MSTTPVWLYEFVSTAPPTQPALGIMSFGLDTDAGGPATNPIGKYGNVHFAGSPFVGSLSCVTPPTSADAIFDVKFSHDNGVTWTSIFPTNAYRYPVGTVGFLLFTSFAAVTFAVGDLLRVDVIQSGGAAGIEGVIRWGPLAPPKQQLISGVASIRGYTSQAIPGKARIGYLTTSATIQGVARISATQQRTLTGKARINVTHQPTITGVAKII